MSDKTIIDYFLENTEKLGDKTWLTQPVGDGEVLTFSYNEVVAKAKQVAGYLESLGYPPKSQIAICSKNCAYWLIADIGIWMAGHVSVPVSFKLGRRNLENRSFCDTIQLKERSNMLLRLFMNESLRMNLIYMNDNVI